MEHHRTAAKYGTRPSALLGWTSKDEAWLAYQYDRAAFRLGEWFETRVNARDAKGNALYDPETLLMDQDTPDAPSTTGRQYRDDFEAIPLRRGRDDT